MKVFVRYIEFTYVISLEIFISQLLDIWPGRDRFLDFRL